MKKTILAFLTLTTFSHAAEADTHLYAGNANACVIDDGVLKCWGDNEFFQLANGNGIDVMTPTTISQFTLPVTAVSVGMHMCAISGNAIWCWGNNDHGEVGTGGTTSVATPTMIAGVGIPTEIASGREHECAVLADTSVWCWGRNDSGQLGDGTRIDRPSPVQALTSGALHLALGDGNRSCALMQDTSVRCWGDLLGGAPAIVPTVVTGLESGVSVLRAGIGQTCVIVNGTSKCWGWNSNGQVGDGTTNSSAQPAPITGGFAFTDFALGGFHSCGLVAGGVYCWGADSAGQLGDGAALDTVGPAPVVGMLSGVDEIASGESFTCARSGASVSCWGDNTYLSLGHANYLGTNNLLPFPVESRSACTATSCATAPAGQTLFTGGDNACVLDGGALKCWGDNYRHELLDGTTGDQENPVAIDDILPPVQTVAIGQDWLCAETNDAVSCRGVNQSGQIGDGSTNSVGVFPPFNIAGLHPVALAAGNAHTCALLADSSVWCWGQNSEGQLGDGTTTDRLTPVRSVAKGAKQVSLSDGLHTCALMSDTSVECWGQNWGANNDAAGYSVLPHVVPGLESGVTVMAAGAYHTCVMISGVAKCWGWDSYGQLGDNIAEYGLITPAPPPTVVAGGLHFDSFSLGIFHSCGLVGADAYCWGNNDAGQLGDGTTIGKATPTLVRSLQGQVRELGANGRFSCARTDSSVQCWGDNTYDELGHANGVGIDYTLPFPVAGLTTCAPLTCAALGQTCGIFADGCSGVIDCGACTTQSACFTTTLAASENYATAQSVDGDTRFTNAFQFLVPSQLNITQGNAGTGSATVAYQDGSGPLTTCEYVSGSNNTYTFASCDSGAHANDLVSANSFHLHVVSGDSSAGTTTVLWPIEAQPCGCIATTCAALDATCGVLTDGCGGLLSCGACSGDTTCGGITSTPLSCGCTPTTCTTAGAECGSLADGCGGTIDCGTCASPDTCGAANRCSCVPTTCAAANASCGIIDDGCGGQLSCGACDAPSTCGGGGNAHSCGCTPYSCAANGRVCGTVTDGCGGVENCGVCAGDMQCTESGACELPVAFTATSTVIATDPLIAGAAVYVPGGSTQAFTVQPPSGATFTEGTSLMAPGGQMVVIAGPEVEFKAVDYTGEYFFPVGAACAEFSVPYDPLLESAGAEIISTLQAFEVKNGALAALSVSGPEKIDHVAHTITFCTLHASIYVVVYSLPCAQIPKLTTASASNAAQAQPPIAASQVFSYYEPSATRPTSLTVTKDSGTTLSGTATYLFAYGTGGIQTACFYKGTLGGTSTSLSDPTCWAVTTPITNALRIAVPNSSELISPAVAPGGCKPNGAKCPSGAQCGAVSEGLNCNDLECGPHNGACPSGQVCSDFQCCVAPTCGGRTCGTVTACGETVTCGPACPPPVTCPAGANCGTVHDPNTNRTITCGGSCATPQTCGGGGSPNICGCTPAAHSCSNQGGHGQACVFTDSCGAPYGCACTATPDSCGANGICGYPGFTINGQHYTTGAAPITPPVGGDTFVLALDDFAPADSSAFTFHTSYTFPTTYQHECFTTTEGVTCGHASDGCGGELNCACPLGQSCSATTNGICGITAAPCGGATVDSCHKCVSAQLVALPEGTNCGSDNNCGVAHCITDASGIFGCGLVEPLLASGDPNQNIQIKCNPNTGTVGVVASSSSASCTPATGVGVTATALSGAYGSQYMHAVSELKADCTTASCTAVLK